MTIRSNEAITIPHSPFHPIFGQSPAVIGGCDVELGSFELVLVKGSGNPWRITLISGACGTGRAVLPSEFETAAKQLGWIVLRAHIGSEMISGFTDVTIPHAFNVIDSALTGKGRCLIDLSIVDVSGFKTEVSTLRPGPSRNLLDQLQDLSALLMPQESGILPTLNEVQSADPAQLNGVIHAVRDLNHDNAEIAFVTAGLPSGIGDLLQLESATFLRCAERTSLGRSDLEAIKDIIRRTAELDERAMTEDAVESVSGLSHGYPYLIQTIDSVAWAKAGLTRLDTVTAQYVSDAVAESIRRTGLQVHAPNLRKVSPHQIVFLKVVARPSPNEKPMTTSAITETMRRKLSGISQFRHDLIYHELIVSASTRYAEFILPYFTDYLNTSVG